MTIKILTVEMVTPSDKPNNGYYYALRCTHYKDNAINGIWEKSFYHRTPENEALEDMVELTNYFTIGAM